MRRFFSYLFKTIAVIFAILFIVSAVLAILLVNIERNMFNANLYKNALTRQQVYARLPDIVGSLVTTSMTYNPCAANPLVCEETSDALRACYLEKLGEERYVVLASGNEQPTGSDFQNIQPCIDQFGSETPASPGGDENIGGAPDFIKNLKSKDIASIISIILPPAELQKMIENVLDQVFTYLNGDISQVKLSLTKLKERLASQPGQDAIKYLLNSQPPCTQEQLTAMLGGGAEGEMIICAPSPDIMAMIMPQLENQLNSAIPQIPDEVVILPPKNQPASPNSGPFGNDPVTFIRIVRSWLRLSPLLPLGFLLLVTLFGVRSFKGWMRWWGIPFFFSGAITLFTGIAILPVQNWAWTNFIIPHIPLYFPIDVVSIGHDLASSVLRSFSGQIALQAGILASIGLVAWVSSTFIKSRRKESFPASLPPAT